MNLLTEPSTACAQAAPKQPMPVWLLFLQRFAAQRRCTLSRLQNSTLGAAAWAAKWAADWGVNWALKVTISLAVAGFITACGPGTGGTGVGPVSGTYVSLAGTTAGAATVPGTSQPGTAQPGVNSAGYVLLLEPMAIRLTGACLAFLFDGAWVEANGEIRVTGSYRQATPASDLALATALPGTLVARVENTGLSVTLLDAGGTVVLSFTTGAKLADGAAAASAPACKPLPAGL